jgi:hypothetical protein
MKIFGKISTLSFAICIISIIPASAQYPPFTKWYENPLGFKPVNLHTVNGIIIPAVAATAILLLTQSEIEPAIKFAYYTDFGASYGYYSSKTTVYQNNLGVLYRARKFMAIGSEFSTIKVSDNINNTWGLGLRPFVRFYPIHKYNFKLFFQSGAGLIHFAQNFPKPSGFFGDNREGTKLNGSPKYGIGTEFKLTKQLFGHAGIWHVHFSNGDHPDYERNPGHDSNGFSFGFIYKTSISKNP